MSTSREGCYAALFALLAATPGIAIASRKLKLLAEVNNAELPALFMQVDRQTAAQKPGTPAQRRLMALVYLYAANPDPNGVASTVLNGLIDAVETAILPAPGAQVQTLGGAVAHAWIDSAIEVYEAPKGQRAASVIPVLMLMP